MAHTQDPFAGGPPAPLTQLIAQAEVKERTRLKYRTHLVEFDRWLGTAGSPHAEGDVRKVQTGDIAWFMAYLRGGDRWAKSDVKKVGRDTPSPSTRKNFHASDIPANYLQLYMEAGHEYETDWWVLAGIGKVETNHGRSTLPGITSGVNAYGCGAGPMQFAVSHAAGCRVCVGDTWRAFGVDGNGDGIKNVYDPADAIPAAANYTGANGAPRDWRRALWRYNQSDAYYHEVMEWADRYGQPATLTPIGSVTRELTSHPNITFHNSCQRSDVLSGQIDPRVLSLLAIVAQAHRIGVSSIELIAGAGGC